MKDDEVWWVKWQKKKWRPNPPKMPPPVSTSPELTCDITAQGLFWDHCEHKDEKNIRKKKPFIYIWWQKSNVKIRKNAFHGTVVVPPSKN